MGLSTVMTDEAHPMMNLSSSQVREYCPRRDKSDGSRIHGVAYVARRRGRTGRDAKGLAEIEGIGLGGSERRGETDTQTPVLILSAALCLRHLETG